MLSSTYAVDERAPVSRTVYRNLRRAIISGDLEAETRIVEGVFAKTLGVSRTPLREALARLEADGLVSRNVGSGYAVANIDEQLGEIFHLRKAIEGYCARLVAEIGPASLVEALRANVVEHRKLDIKEVEERARLNAAFHTMIADACPSQKVRERVHELREFNFGPEEMELHPDRPTIQSFLDEHLLIVDAIEAHNGDAAARATRLHLDRALELLLARRKTRTGERQEG